MPEKRDFNDNFIEKKKLVPRRVTLKVAVVTQGLTPACFVRSERTKSAQFIKRMRCQLANFLINT